MAGAIRWVQSLIHRIKHTILPFLKMPEMLESEQSKAVSYFTVAQLYRSVLILNCLHTKMLLKALM